MLHTTRPLLASLLAVASLAACGKPTITPRVAPGAELASITVTSSAFGQGARIPVDHTCDGRDEMPDLVLSSPPDRTKSLVVVVDDPDAPDGVFTHAIAFDLSPELRKLPAGGNLEGAGQGAQWGLNDFGAAHYSGPCPPKGEAHRYRFRVIALDKVLGLPEGAPKVKVDEAMDGHILGEGVLTGFFGH